MLHLFSNSLVQVIYSRVSGYYSHAIYMVYIMMQYYRHIGIHDWCVTDVSTIDLWFSVL